MASLSFDEKNKRYRIRFQAPDESIRCISISQRPNEKRKGLDKRANSMLNHIDELIEYRASGQALTPAQLKWLDGLKPAQRKTLLNAGLVGIADTIATAGANTLADYLTQWFGHRADSKRSTILAWRNVERNLVGYFGADKSLGSITQDDAENFERWLSSNQKLSPATTRKRIQISKQILESARKARLIPENPFAEMKTGAINNKSRQHFVSIPNILRVLDACSSTEWRLAVVLARFGALRVPSEIRNLKWEDINWEHRCFRVYSPKLHHHEDKAERIVPLFPEIERELTDLQEVSGMTSVYVLPNIRLTTNVHPTMTRIVERAGLKPWPRLWQNLRASRATELEAQFGGSKAATICGHAEKVAQDHYWMTTAEDITAMASVDSVHLLSMKATKDGCNGLQAVSLAHEKTPGFPGFSGLCVNSQRVQMGAEGLEPPTPSV